MWDLLLALLLVSYNFFKHLIYTEPIYQTFFWGIGLLFTTNYASVYAGLWGYNPALTSVAVGVVFFVPTALSGLNALAAVLFTVGTQLVMSTFMGPVIIKVYIFCFSFY